MKGWIVVLKVFGYIWLTGAVLLFLVGIAGTWTEGGFSAVQDLLSPLNVANWVVTAIAAAPGIGAIAWAKHLSGEY